MASHFYAILSRMKYIKRWGLMRNSREENLSEHSLEVAFIAHALAIINNKRLNGSVSPSAAALSAMYHDTSEILTGDLPTPIKYNNPEIRTAYKKIEEVAEGELVSMLPEDLREEFNEIYSPSDQYVVKIVKAADKLSALIKCIEERNMGNKEFLEAEKSTLASLNDMSMPEVDIFISEFLESYSLTLDEQRQKNEN